MFVIDWFAEQSLCHGPYTYRITTPIASLEHLMCSFHRFNSCFFQIIFLSEKKNPTCLFFSTVNHSCPDDQFKCQNNRCIPKRWLCDGANDCGNNEDESNKTCAGKNSTWLCKQIL